MSHFQFLQFCEIIVLNISNWFRNKQTNLFFLFENQMFWNYWKLAYLIEISDMLELYPCQSERKANEQLYLFIHLYIFIDVSRRYMIYLTHFFPIVLSNTPWKHQTIRFFPMFSGCIESKIGKIWVNSVQLAWFARNWRTRECYMRSAKWWTFLKSSSDARVDKVDSQWKLLIMNRQIRSPIKVTLNWLNSWKYDCLTTFTVKLEKKVP